ncbi:MAG: hypothetical protein ACYCSS_05675 [Sulfuriferula sp.]
MAGGSIVALVVLGAGVTAEVAVTGSIVADAAVVTGETGAGGITAVVASGVLGTGGGIVTAGSAIQHRENGKLVPSNNKCLSLHEKMIKLNNLPISV